MYYKVLYLIHIISSTYKYALDFNYHGDILFWYGNVLLIESNQFYLPVYIHTALDVLSVKHLKFVFIYQSF